MKRRQFLGGVLALPTMAYAQLSARAQAAVPVRKPNIILIVADDLGVGDLGIYGSTLVRTPHLDALAMGGTRFTNFFASSNICSQSRAGMLTGRFAIRSGLANGVIQANHTNGLPQQEVTLAEMLKPDYATALIGKWHLGHVPPFWPPRLQGFDYFYGLPYSHNMVPLSMYTSGQGVELISGDVDFHRLTEQFFDRAEQFIEAQASKPFFLKLALTAPHVPLDPNPDYSHQSRAGDYGDVIEEIDTRVGRLVDRLRALEIEGDTLIMFTSDNGPWFEGSSGDARDRKGGAGWDGGYKVPLILSQPGRVPAGAVRDAISMNIDFMPTLAAWTGMPLPQVEIDGRNIVDVILNGGPSPHADLLFFNDREITGIRTQRWKLVKRSYYRGYNIDLADYMITRHGALLFDLEQDPGELYSVATRHPDIFSAMMARLEEARATYSAFQ